MSDESARDEESPGPDSASNGLVLTEESAPWAAVKIGTTPDNNWSWWAVGLFMHDPDTDGYDVVDIIGVITESKEGKMWSEDKRRNYRTMSYDPSDYPGSTGSMAYSIAGDLETAIERMVTNYRRMGEQQEQPQFAGYRRINKRGEASYEGGLE